MTHVVDASAVVAALIGGGATGDWAETVLARGDLAAPHIMPAEAANILRRASMTGEISPDAAALAQADLQALPVEFFPYAPFADRIWALRANVTCYDGWYIAIAEYLGAAMVTLDARLSRAPGPHCSFVRPPA